MLIDLDDDGTAGTCDVDDTSDLVSSPTSENWAGMLSSERGEDGAIEEPVLEDMESDPSVGTADGADISSHV